MSYDGGSLTVYTGPMYSNKTAMLIMQMHRNSISKLPWIAFKSDFDTRTGNFIATRSGVKPIAATTLPQDQPELMFQYVKDKGFVAVDELHFWAPHIGEVLAELR